jgi:hypothetical protein
MTILVHVHDEIVCVHVHLVHVQRKTLVRVHIMYYVCVHVHLVHVQRKTLVRVHIMYCTCAFVCDTYQCSVCVQ